ncbi:hypothetical protein LAZ67_9000462 [Cordylochernes scorpioides]|uniref:Integrase catalytic domain-containing protein n=1 Tax=Cordylochernes scorpioides TaxID=51811 RepID=A0ABY6KSH6_9ARAC|nr:hypothetical protein LAZ67_9000462 [Cordylochernes scorpioides]
MEMEYEQSRREFFRHSLFGGSSTDVVEHEVYTIHLSDINNSYRCEFEALGQPLICGSIPPVCPRSFLEGSEELDVSDLMRDRIEVLIGADIAGRLLTDAQRRISSGLVAIGTKLGWTVMGKIPPTEVRDDTSSLCVTTLLSLDLENLWKLDAIGVSDAEVEKKTQSLQAGMEEHFAHTTTRDIEGRYEVALPWVQDKKRIPSNRDLVENQLGSVRRKLEEVGDMNEYGQIFEEWMEQGIIEYAREDKLDGVHYLPHRPVYKRNSQTSRIRPVFNASARKRGKLSLNDCLDKRLNLIEIIPRLLNKFRIYEVGASSDIEKTFLQIGIKEEDRDAAVFEIAGVDLTGNLILKNKKKAWIVIFTCAVYRGVHLELVTSLSMEAFLQAFRRFIARRGRALIVYSDNGTNFKGMANALKKIDFSRLKCDPTLKNITWKFIPPGAPWWGGWWERLIGMMKQLLFRILGQTSLGYEELSTVMCDVESLMNTRPLTYLTEESEDLVPLTPSLFLHEVREVGVPDLDLIDNQTLSHKYQYVKRVREDLRERFRIEYFGFLRQETRRLKTTIPFKVGDMVLIGQESLKRLHWPLARIIQLYPGKDGLVRVAKVKTSSGDKIRPIQKLYNLEITPEIRCRDPLTERSPTQEVRLTTEENPLTSQQEQHHIETPNVVSSFGRHIKRPNRLDLLNFSFPCLSRRGANSKSVVAVNFLEHSVGFSGTFLPVEGEQQNFPQMGTFWPGNHHFPRAPEIFHDLNFSKTPRMLMPHHSISTRTISRRLVANGLHSCRPLRRLPLTPPNRRQRLEWCRARSTWMTEWHRVVFSYESRFCLSSYHCRVRVWRRRGERSNPAAIVERPTVRQRGIMVWGAIAYDSRSPLLRIQGTMTAQRYVDDVLRPVTLPYLQEVPNALYQQDNARPHTARISQQALQDVQMLPWPPYSPDLSPIEHVWDIIGRRLHALPQPRSEDELWQMVEREWRAIPQDAIRTLIDSLPRRVAACIAVRGGPTCY